MEIREVFCPECDSDFTIGLHPDDEVVAICDCRWRPLSELFMFLFSGEDEDEGPMKGFDD